MDIKVQETKNYKRFKLHQKNRRLNYNKIRKLSEAMQDHNLLPIFPIIIDKDNVILDGQHRFEAAKMAKVPIHFIISKNGYDINRVAESNSFQSSWKLSDYVNFYAKEGKQPYIELKKVASEYKVSITIAANLSDTYTVNNEIKDGTFTFNAKDRVIKILDHAKEIGAEHGFDHWKTRAFLRAIAYVLDIADYSQMRMHQKIQANRSMFVRCADAKEYLALLEKIYNSNCKKEVRFL